MAKVELIMPKMGESIMEATIPIGTVIAIIATEGEEAVSAPSPAVKETNTPAPAAAPTKAALVAVAPADVPVVNNAEASRFYSPLVKNIATKEGIELAELETVSGTGSKGRVTKKDILAYVANRSGASTAASVTSQASAPAAMAAKKSAPAAPKVSHGGNVEIIEMDRMRKLIADHMVMSKHTSPHVTSFVEADVTNIVNWRNSVKGEFIKTHGQKITFTPIFIEAVVKAIKDYPGVNASVDGTNIIMKKDINIGMAAALPSGNLIVPVIKNADTLNMVGLTKKVNDLASKARSNDLSPSDIQGGTFTLTNVGTFGNVMGTPIINQPQVAILAVGAIRKKPAVVETEYGDLIAVRQMMYLSLSYDHRVVDGMLGGSFLRRVADYLEAFDTDQKI